MIMNIIGLTGLIGSGKSEVGRVLRQQKIDVIDTDVIAKQITQEDKTVASFEKQTDNTLRAVAREAEKGKKKSWWGWIMGSVGLLGIGGIIALCVFFPAVIPLVINVFATIIGLINKLIGFLILYSFK
jgi:hypothetical protein